MAGARTIVTAPARNPLSESTPPSPARSGDTENNRSYVTGPKYEHRSGPHASACAEIHWVFAERPANTPDTRHRAGPDERIRTMGPGRPQPHGSTSVVCTPSRPLSGNRLGHKYPWLESSAGNGRVSGSQATNLSMNSTPTAPNFPSVSMGHVRRSHLSAGTPGGMRCNSPANDATEEGRRQGITYRSDSKGLTYTKDTSV